MTNKDFYYDSSEVEGQPAQPADLKAGMEVDIFSDPLTCEKLEGRAKLVRFLFKMDDAQSFWNVQFVGEDGVYQRIVNRYCCLEAHHG